MKRKVQAQRKYAQGAYVPPSAPASVPPPIDRRPDSTANANLKVYHSSLSAGKIIDLVSYQNFTIKEKPNPHGGHDSTSTKERDDNRQIVVMLNRGETAKILARNQARQLEEESLGTDLSNAIMSARMNIDAPSVINTPEEPIIERPACASSNVSTITSTNALEEVNSAVDPNSLLLEVRSIPCPVDIHNSFKKPQRKSSGRVNRALNKPAQKIISRRSSRLRARLRMDYATVAHSSLDLRSLRRSKRLTDDAVEAAITRGHVESSDSEDNMPLNSFMGQQKRRNAVLRSWHVMNEARTRAKSTSTSTNKPPPAESTPLTTSHPVQASNASVAALTATTQPFSRPEPTPLTMSHPVQPSSSSTAVFTATTQSSPLSKATPLLMSRLMQSSGSSTAALNGTAQLTPKPESIQTRKSSTRLTNKRSSESNVPSTSTEVNSDELVHAPTKRSRSQKSKTKQQNVSVDSNSHSTRGSQRRNNNSVSANNIFNFSSCSTEESEPEVVDVYEFNAETEAAVSSVNAFRSTQNLNDTQAGASTAVRTNDSLSQLSPTLQQVQATSSNTNRASQTCDSTSKLRPTKVRVITSKPVSIYFKQGLNSQENVVEIVDRRPSTSQAEMSSAVNQTPSGFNQTPSAVNQTPSAVNQTPSAVNQMPSAVNETPSAVNETPSAVNQTLSVVNQTPPTVNQSPSADNQSLSADNQTPSVVNQTPSAVNETLSAVNHSPSEVNQTSSAINQTPSAFNQTPSAVNQMPSAVNQTPSAVNETPSAVNETPSAVNQTPSTVNETPSGVNQTPSVVNQTLSVVNQTPLIVNQSPSADNQTPSVVNQTPSAVNQTPSAVNQTPSAVNQTSSAVNQTSSAVNQTSSAVNQTSSAVNQTSSAVNQTPSAVNQMPSAVNQMPSAVNQMPSAVNQTSEELRDLEILNMLSSSSSSEEDSLQDDYDVIRVRKKKKQKQREPFPTPFETAKLVKAPVFYPSVEEFSDPLMYIESIAQYGSAYGICKIVPPIKFTPSCYMPEDAVFQPRSQYLARLFNRWSPSSKAMCTFLANMTNHVDPHNSKPRNTGPLCHGTELDLDKMHRIVTNLGGLEKVMEEGKWGEVASLMGLKPTPKTEKIIDNIYMRCLLPYDTMSLDEREALKVHVENIWSRHYNWLLKRAENPLQQLRPQPSAARMTAARSNSAKQITMESVVTSHEDCIVQAHYNRMTFKEFKNAAETGSTVYPDAEKDDIKRVECFYWDVVMNGTKHVHTYSASIDTSYICYGFYRKRDSYSTNPWNLKMLTRNKGNVLRSMGSLPGVTAPMVHLGMLYTTSCWHRDPHGLPWIEYQHSGPNKIWYGIPESHSDAFKGAVRRLCPILCQNKSIWLPSDVVMISPSTLVQNNVSLCRLEQKPGEFVIVFPKAYSSSISTGLTVSESVYFALARWLRTALQVFEETRNSCEPTMFSLEQLLLAVVKDKTALTNLKRDALRSLLTVVRSELRNRLELDRVGVLVVHENEPQPSTSNANSNADWRDCEQDECVVCRATLHLSKVRGLVAQSRDDSFCLPHALKRLTEMYEEDPHKCIRTQPSTDTTSGMGDNELLEAHRRLQEIESEATAKLRRFRLPSGAIHAELVILRRGADIAKVITHARRMNFH
ncbi:hypothetical protein ACJJTC_000861 [Scirpophaga incertulas]